MKGNRTAGTGRKGFKGGRLPNGFSKLTRENIADLAKTGSSENDSLFSLGLSASQVEWAKKNNKWRRAWDRARAEWITSKNREISSSGDVRILQMLASQTMPQGDLPDSIVVDIDAPKWFVEALNKKSA